MTQVRAKAEDGPERTCDEAGAARREVPERRCIVTGAHGAKEDLLRFVVAPDGTVVPDLKARLPGRGMWVTVSRAVLERAIAKRLFARAAKAPVNAPEALAGDVERLLVKAAQGLLGLAFKAGEVRLGFAKVERGLADGRLIALIEAADAGPHGAAKLTRAAAKAGVPVVTVLTSAEMGLALGRENMVHAGLNEGRLARRFLEDAWRLQKFRGGEQASAESDVLLAGEQKPQNEE